MWKSGTFELEDINETLIDEIVFLIQATINNMSSRTHEYGFTIYTVSFRYAPLMKLLKTPHLLHFHHKVACRLRDFPSGTLPHGSASSPSDGAVSCKDYGSTHREIPEYSNSHIF